MAEEKTSDKKSHAKHAKRAVYARGRHKDAVYVLGMIGAFVYYIHFHSGTLWLVILAVLKAIIWPALLVYHFFILLQL
ncbi:MAG: hypothetical protein ACHQT9_02105 [Candidatus Saccharimonadales bacterium]